MSATTPFPAATTPAVWQAEAETMVPSWLRPWWRPRILVKRGRFSPWWFFFSPGVWAAPNGAFNLLMVIAVSDDWIADCPPAYRKAILAHECGHLVGFHWAIWILVALFTFNSDVPGIAIGSVGSWIVGWGGLAAAFGFAVAAAILAVLALGWLQVWFEHRADDYAVGRVGYADTVGALRWILGRRPPGAKSPWLESRLRRLERNAGAGR